MRDKPRELTAGPGVYRIAILGEPFMEALQVADGEYTAALIEQQLISAGKKS